MSPGLWLVAGDLGDVVPLADGSWATKIHHSSCNSMLEGCQRHQPLQLLCWVAVLGLTDLTKALAGIEVGGGECTPSDLHVHLGCHGSACMLFRSLSTKSYRSKPQARAVAIPDRSLASKWPAAGLTRCCAGLLERSEVQDLLHWRLLSRRTSSPEACSLLRRFLTATSRKNEPLPGPDRARGRDGQHGEARKDPGTLNQPNPVCRPTPCKILQSAAVTCTPERRAFVSAVNIDGRSIALRRGNFSTAHDTVNIPSRIPRAASVESASPAPQHRCYHNLYAVVVLAVVFSLHPRA